MAMRDWSTALCILGAGLVLAVTTGKADARGVGGGGWGGSRGGVGFVGGHGWGGRSGGIGGHGHGRAHGVRHGHRHWGQGHHHHRFGQCGRFGGVYGSLPYGGYGGYGSDGYDPAPSRSAGRPHVGIPPSAYLPPAIYVIGDKSGRAANRPGSVVRKGSGSIGADSRDAAGGSSVVVTRRDPGHRHRAR